MDAREFRQEAARGRVPLEELVGRLIDRVEQLETRVRGLEAENKRLKSKLEQYEPPEKAPASGLDQVSDTHLLDQVSDTHLLRWAT